MDMPDKKSLLGEMLAEFLGTLILIALGDGVVAMVVLFGKDVPGGVFMGGYTNITLGWGLAVFMAICVAGRVSGAHINPAVTLAMAAFRGFPWRKTGPYILAQVLGGFAGAALVYFNYWPAFQEFENLNISKRINPVSIFATFPRFPDFVPISLLDQIIGTAFLLGFIFAIIDPRNALVPPSLQPFAIGLVVVAIGVSWGGMHGYAINPARDFGPRLFAWVAGFKQTGFNTDAWWVPIVGPLVGGLLGGITYDSLIRPYLPAKTGETS
jgi:glycerol uptake facilitator protein